MYKILILLSLLIFSVFNIKAQNTLSSPFKKEYHNFKIDTSIVVAVPYKGNFYCLKSNGGIFLINAQNNLLECPNFEDIKDIKLTNLYIEKGLLIGTGKKKSYFLNDKNQWIALRNTVILPAIFEDENYIVKSTCSGEWGGSLFFLSKKSNKVYECSSTCSVNILKFNGKYIITSTLAHLSGFTNVFEIDNPEKLKVRKRDTSFVKILPNGKRVSYVGDNESKSKIGTNQLIDSVGIESNGSFAYDNELFYIITKRHQTLITKITDKKLTTIDTLANFSMWSYNPIYRSYPDKTICSFSNYDNTGFVSITGNKLTLYTFDWKHK